MTWLKDLERQDLTVQEGIPVHPELFEKIRATEQLAEPPNQIAERRMHQILYELADWQAKRLLGAYWVASNELLIVNDESRWGPGMVTHRTKKKPIKILALKGTKRAYFKLPVSLSVPSWTTLLSISGTGQKLAPIFTFKYKKKVSFAMDEIREDVMTTLGVKDLPEPLCTISHSRTAWMNSRIYREEYLEQVLNPYRDSLPLRRNDRGAFKARQILSQNFLILCSQSTKRQRDPSIGPRFQTWVFFTTASKGMSLFKVGLYWEEIQFSQRCWLQIVPPINGWISSATAC